MNIIILNLSKKKSFRQTKRMISMVVPPITNRVNIGDLPKRVIIRLIKNLKEKVNRGTNIKIFIESKEGFRGFKCFEIGKKSNDFEFWINSKSFLDKEIP